VSAGPAPGRAPDSGAEEVKENAAGEYDEPPMAREATQLMLAAKSGDRQAFDQLVERLRGRAFRVAHALVGSRDDALELSQETFLKVYRARDTFRAGEAFLPWFHRILRNTCFSHLRARGRLRPRSVSEHPANAVGTEELDYDIASKAPGPDELATSDERALAFHRTFDTLSARDREILTLRHFHEQSYKEIAAALGLPEGTVMSRLFHARRRLRAALGASFADHVGGERDDSDGGGDG
jgi:RNA polymerase sigma-70 factor (ECF subfamily)